MRSQSGQRNPNYLFVPDRIEYQGKQLYYLEQAADHVPLRRNLTAEEAKQYGIIDTVITLPGELLTDAAGKSEGGF